MNTHVSAAKLVDYAGRQRMLNQRMMKETLAEWAGEPRRYPGTLSLIRKTASGMRDGGDMWIDGATRDLPSLPAPTPELHHLLSSQLQLIDDVERAIESFLQAPAEGIQAPLKELLRRGDLFHTAANDTTREMAAYTQALQQAAENRQRELETRMREVLQSVLDRAQRLTDVATRLDQATQAMSGEAAHSVQETDVQSTLCKSSSDAVQTMAAATEQLNASIREIAQQLHATTRVSHDAVEAVHRTSSNMAKLGDDAGQIGRAAALISGVAQQTNVLALNATIEAVRAGEFGKGFAIVAREVKDLSKQTGKAAHDIGDFLDTVKLESETAVSAVQDIARLFDQLDAANTLLSSSVEEQQAAAAELARGIAEAAAQVQRIADGAAAVSQSAGVISGELEQTRTESGLVAHYASELRDWVLSIDSAR